MARYLCMFAIPSNLDLEFFNEASLTKKASSIVKLYFLLSFS